MAGTPRRTTQRVGNSVTEQGDTGDPDLLLRGGALEQALERSKEQPLRAELETYIKSSNEHQRQRIARDRRRTRFLAVLAVISTVVSITAFLLFIRAQQQEQAAQLQLRIATARQLMSQADALIDDDPRTALQLGLAAQQIHDGTETQASLVTSLITTHYAATLTGHERLVDAVAVSTDGTTLATGSTDKTVQLWSLDNPFQPAPIGSALRSQRPRAFGCVQLRRVNPGRRRR